jgi:hypothetical protein
MRSTIVFVLSFFFKLHSALSEKWFVRNKRLRPFARCLLRGSRLRHRRRGLSQHMIDDRPRGHTKPRARMRYRYRPSTVALREIHHYQRKVDGQSHSPSTLSATRAGAVTGLYDRSPLDERGDALQEAAEAYLVGLFEDTNLCPMPNV